MGPLLEGSKQTDKNEHDMVKKKHGVWKYKNYVMEILSMYENTACQKSVNFLTRGEFTELADFDNRKIY